MTTLVDLASYRRARRPVSFQPDELRALMNLYSRRVMSGEWRDYAIDFQHGYASFTMFKHTFDAPLFTVVKLLRRSGGLEWLVFKGNERVKRSGALKDALVYFEKKLELVT